MAEGILDSIIRPLAERVFFAGFWWGALAGFLVALVLYASLQRTRALTVVLPLVIVALAYMATGGGRSPVPLPLAPRNEPVVVPDEKPDPKPRPPRKPLLPWRGEIEAV